MIPSRPLSRPARYPWGLALALLSALALLAGLAACTSSGTAPPPTAVAPPAAPAAGARLVFQEREHDFGSISHNGDKIEYRVPFTNTGSQPLQVGETKLAPLDPSSCA